MGAGRFHQIADIAVLGETRRSRWLRLSRPAIADAFYAKQIVASLVEYGMSLLPPFFGGLVAYDAEANIAFDCPGHQGGQFYRKSPAGQLFFKHFGEQIFRNDLCNADVDLGDLLIHVGPAVDAQRHAAQVFGADRTYFVLNGTTTSNKVVTSAVLKRGDLVLFDRNNHKSLHQGALVQAGAIPIFLPTARNPFGMIGAVDWDAWDEKYLRDQIRLHPLLKDTSNGQGRAPVPPGVHPARDLRRHDLQRAQGAWRRSATSATTCSWDEAWIGYNAFHPLFHDHSPMRIEKLTPEMPGLFSTQSVHKQGAGFSQASQIHKRDEHIQGQRRFVEHKRFNESFLMNASTSPFYPLFASLDVNAKVHEGKAGEMLWDRCIELAIEARRSCASSVITTHARAATRRSNGSSTRSCPTSSRSAARSSRRTPRTSRWEDLPTEVIKHEQQCWNFDPKARGTATPGYSDGYAMVDPNKLDAAHAGYRSQDRRIPRLRRAGHGARQLPARAAHRPGEVRPQQHPVPDDARRGRKQAQHADRQAGQVQEPVGPRCAARRGAADALRAEQRALRGLHRCGRCATRCTTSTARRTSRSCRS